MKKPTIYADVCFQNTTHIFRSTCSTRSTLCANLLNWLLINDINSMSKAEHPSKDVEKQAIL